MKKVITDKDTTVVATADASARKFYAAINPSGVYTGFITMTNTGYVLKPLGGISDGMIVGGAGCREELDDMLDHLIIEMDYDMREFDTAKEMFIAIGDSLK